MESASIQDTKDVVERDLNPMVICDSIIFPPALIGKSRPLVDRCPPNELRLQAQERGLTRAITRKRPPDAVEQSPVVRTIILAVAILVRIFVPF